VNPNLAFLNESGNEYVTLSNLTSLTMKNDIAIYEGEDGKVELRADLEKDTIWATQEQIADIFSTTVPNISLHLKNIYKEGELTDAATIKKSLRVQKEGGRAVRRALDLYNLDAIIAVGYRVNSKKATQFRIWATNVLRQYVVNGYSLNHYKLEKSPNALFELYAAMARIDSKASGGKFRGKVTIKLTEDFDPRK